MIDKNLKIGDWVRLNNPPWDGKFYLIGKISSVGLQDGYVVIYVPGLCWKPKRPLIEVTRISDEEAMIYILENS